MCGYGCRQTSVIDIRLSDELHAVKFKGDEVTEPDFFVSVVNTVVERDEIVTLGFDEKLDEAVFDWHVTVNDFLAAGFESVDLEIASPHHRRGVFKWVVDVEVHACMDEDKIVKFDEKLAVAHPIDIFLIYFTWTFHPEALQSRLGTITFPFFVDTALGKQSVLVVFKSVYTVTLMISNEIVNIVTIFLEAHDIVDYTFSIWTTIDVVAKKIQGVFRSRLDDAFNQLLKSVCTSMDVRYNPSFFHDYFAFP